MALTRITSDGITDGTITGTDLTTNIDLVDNQKLRLGTGNDLRIYFSGNDAFIENHDMGSTIKFKTKHFVSGFQERVEINAKGDFSILRDDAKLQLGASQDLQIYHDGSHNIINGAAGQNLEIQTNAFRLRNQADSESMIVANADGAVELYYDNSKKFETYANGCTVTGNLNAGNVDLGDNAKARFGGSNDLQIYHDGTNTYLDNNTGQFNIDAASGNGIRFLVDGVYQCQVYTSGIDLPDTKKLRLGDSEDLQIFHDGSLGGSNIAHVGSGNLHIRAKSGEESIVAVPDGQVEIYHDSSKKFETQSWGCEVTGQLHATGSVKVGDNAEIQIGTSADLKIYHDGTNNQLLATNGPIHMYTGTAIELRKGYDASYETMLKAVPNGAVELYYDNYKAYVTNGGGGPSNGMLSADSVLNLNTSQDGSGSDYFVRGSKNSTVVGGGNDVFWIYEDGDMYNVNGTFSQSSDIKLKENIVDASSQWSDIKALKVRKFNFKASTGYGTHTQIGMVAQEVETTCPGLITERVDLQKTENSDKTWTETDTGEKTKSIKLTVLYMKAVKALQEAMTRIETLETEVAALKAG